MTFGNEKYTISKCKYVTMTIMHYWLEDMGDASLQSFLTGATASLGAFSPVQRPHAILEGSGLLFSVCVVSMSG